MNLREILSHAIAIGASDIHIVPGHPLMVKVHGVFGPEERFGVFAPEHTERMVVEMVGEERFQLLKKGRDLDFSTRADGCGRFRANAHYQRETIGLALRAIPNKAPALSDLNLPPAVAGFAEFPRGLVLVTGPTGAGKSTTLTALINQINRTQSKHIITLEDPVEYEISSDKCLVEQREVGADVTSFASGLRHALRQAPDVILVGEMRDLETTAAAISAAETGHLVLSTLHTQSAAQSIERIVDIYPQSQQSQIRSMLSNTLRAVLTQILFRRVDRPGVVPGCEVMLCTPAVRACIRESRIHEIPTIIETSRQQGMCLLDDSIKTLLFNGKISQEDALAKAANPAALRKLLNS